MRYRGSRNKIARREKMDLGLKTVGSAAHAQLIKKLNIKPGQHGTKGKRKTSEHGLQLQEKQKVRWMYGLTEKKLKSYFKLATKKKENTALIVTQFLERRLDTVVYRLGFAPTMAAARQLVNHKNVKVNDAVVNIPSYQVKIDDVITLSNKIYMIEYFAKSLSNKDTVIPAWLERKDKQGKFIAMPTSEKLDGQVDLRSVIEFYSR